MPLLEPSNFISQSFWVLIFFTAQYLLIAKLIAPSFRGVFKSRKDYIQRQIDLADQFTKEAEKLKSEYELNLEKAKQQNIEQMHLLIEKIKEDSANKLANLEHELQIEHESSENRIHNFIDNSSDDLNKIALDTASNIINRISGDKPKKSELTKYLN